MATASATANEALRSTCENENYQRLSRLIMRAGTELLRAQFDSFYPPSSLANKLSEFATKQKLFHVLLKPQRDLVYPAPGLFGESRDFDISLLSQLLKTLCPTQLPPLRSGWNNPPSRGDFSLTADIVRIKFYRNDIIHKFHSGELSDAEFCSLWDEIKIVLLRIASHISADTKIEWEEAINRLRDDPLTPEAARNAEELQEMYQRDMIAKECLASGFARVEGQIQDVRNQIVQLRELVTNRASSSSAEGGGRFKEETVLLYEIQ